MKKILLSVLLIQSFSLANPILKFNWIPKNAGINADVTITNDLNQDIDNIEIDCEFLNKKGKSTVENKIILDGLAKANQKTNYKNVKILILDSGATENVNCRIKNYKKL